LSGATAAVSSIASLTIRAASVDDVERLAAWAEAMALETEHKRLDPDTVRAGVRAVLDRPARGRYFIAERVASANVRSNMDADGTAREAVGTLMLTHEWSDWRNGDWWWIQSVYVQPAARRSGVYRALYDHVHALAQAAPDVCGLRLYVERENASAQRTYESLGMRDAGYAMFEAEFVRR
jgi:ribosomal protein S18 acetylase RimI-like enzyme